MLEVLSREAVYISYYFEIQLRQILGWYLIGTVTGSLISVFMKDRLLKAVSRAGRHSASVPSIALASVLGILSPLCMYGTIPIASSLSKGGIRDSFLASFMMSSILLNPQLALYSFALGGQAVAVRLVSCTLCGIFAGLAARLYGKPFLSFEGIQESASRDTDSRLLLRLVKNIGRNLKVTGPYFLAGVLLSALFQRYVPSEAVSALFGENEGFGVLMAATIGVPLYACGGGTIPLLRAWLADGMSLGSAAAFMISGPATKITNLGAVKIVLKGRVFAFYLGFVILSSLLAGLLTDVLI